MKTIEQLAREAWQLEFIPESDTPKLQRFAELVIAQYRESLLAGVGEAVGVVKWVGFPDGKEYVDWKTVVPNGTLIYTADQLAAAVLRAQGAKT